MFNECLNFVAFSYFPHKVLGKRIEYRIDKKSSINSHKETNSFFRHAWGVYIHSIHINIRNRYIKNISLGASKI